MYLYSENLCRRNQLEPDLPADIGATGSVFEFTAARRGRRAWSRIWPKRGSSCRGGKRALEPSGELIGSGIDVRPAGARNPVDRQTARAFPPFGGALVAAEEGANPLPGIDAPVGSRQVVRGLLVCPCLPFVAGFGPIMSCGYLGLRTLIIFPGHPEVFVGQAHARRDVTAFFA
jgi:hypothetical protein